MTTLIVLAVLVIVLSVLDSVTTEIGLFHLPKGLRVKEGNPIGAWLFARSRILAEALKHILTLGVVAYCVLMRDILCLKVGVILLSLVVVSNTYALVGTIVTKRKILSLFRRLQLLFHIPDRWFYLFIVLFMLLVALLVVRLWG